MASRQRWRARMAVRVFLVVIDNLRWDQWRTIAPTLRPKWNVVEETTYFSMLPTATQYARNALFAGMTPGDIARMMPKCGLGNTSKGPKTRTKKRCNKACFRLGVTGKTSYHKITNLQSGKRLADRFHELKGQSVRRWCTILSTCSAMHAPRWRSSRSWPTTKRRTAV